MSGQIVDGFIGQDMVELSLEDGDEEKAMALDLAAAFVEAAEVTRFQSRDSEFGDAAVFAAMNLVPDWTTVQDFTQWFAQGIEQQFSETGEQLQENMENVGEEEELLIDEKVKNLAIGLVDWDELSDIAILIIKEEPCFYSRDFMTDAFAQWLRLSREGDDVATFLSCVREESRIYPRPMQAASLENPPFSMSPERVREVYELVCESGECSDIKQTEASNGDVYYYSSDYLSEKYARSLAEWYSVDYRMNP